MNKKCTICGYSGENVWRDGKYYCATCGSEIDVTQKDNNANTASSEGMTVNAECPICKNDKNNILQDGKCRCSLCGTSFDYHQTVQSNCEPTNTFFTDARRAELEKQKNNKLIWGIVWLILCWPVSIYFFYKMYQLSQEISKL